MRGKAVSIKRVTALAAVFLFALQPLVLFATSQSAAAVPPSFANTLRTTVRQQKIERDTGTTTISTKAIWDFGFGWDAIQAAGLGTSITARSNTGLVTNECGGVNWSNETKKAITITKSVEADFCFKAATAGEHVVQFVAQMPQISGSPKTLTASVTITVVDTVAPTATIEYAPANGKQPGPSGSFNDDARATLTASEPIAVPSGWTGNEGDTVFTKIFTQNESGEVKITDLSGNDGAAQYAITGINKTITVTLNQIAPGFAPITVSGTATWSADGTVVENGVIQLAADGKIFEATINDGVWKGVLTSILDPKQYTVTVTGIDGQVLSEGTLSRQFVILATPVEPELPVVKPDTPPLVQLPVQQRALVQRSTAATSSSTFRIAGSEPEVSVLGEQTTRQAATPVDSKDAPVVAPTNEGWKLFGLVWYWWVLLLVAIGGLIWGALRRRQLGRE